MVTLNYRTLVAFFVGVALAIVAGFAFQAWRADAAPGDADSTFVPITACRIIDTRPAFQVGPRGTPLGTAGTHTVSAHGFTGNCTIPTDAVGLSLNVTAVDATLPTFLTIWATGELRPEASSLNPAPGQPPTPNAVATGLSGSGSFSIYNLQGNVHVLADVNGYYTKSSLQQLAAQLATAESKIDALEAVNATGLDARITELETLLDSASLLMIDGKPTFRFAGVNVQVVDGTGVTGGMNAPIGLGNLIVGYNEENGMFPGGKTGSHNVVIGYGHRYDGKGGLVVGNVNQIGDWAFAAGLGNSATGDSSSVTGGVSNTASGPVSSVTGGENNDAQGFKDTVIGGDGIVCDTSGFGVCGEGTLDPLD